MNKRERTRGFTLVELSIVLVIIGLVISGVVVGQELVFQARVQNAIKAVNNVESATAAFYEKYRYPLPGDFRSATAFIGGANTVDGNANGVLAGDLLSETLQFFTHLSAAGLIEGGYPGQFGNNESLPGTFFEGYRMFPSDWYTAIPGTVSITFFRCAPIDPNTSHSMDHLLEILSNYDDCGIGTQVRYAYPVDAKMDDGRPFDGKVQTWARGGVDCSQIVTIDPDTGGLTGSGDEYNLDNPEAPCTSAISILRF